MPDRANLEALAGQVQSAAAGVVASLRTLDRDLEQQMMRRAAEDSADYALARMLTALPIRGQKYRGAGRLDLLEHALSLVAVEGFYAEFGVLKGESLVFMCNRIDTVAYGFDHFQGLPEDWFLQYRKGYLGLDGVAPNLVSEQRNHRLVAGPFKESIPYFTSQIDGPAAFLHVDCDLYSSTCDVLEGLADRIVAGTVILFGTYLNYPGWREHQFKAWQAFTAARGIAYRYAAFAPAMFSVAVVVERVET